MVHVQRTGQVDRDQLIPESGFGFQKRHETVEGGIVHQHRRQTELAGDGFDGGDDGVVIGDVGGVGDRGTAVSGDRVDGALRRRLIAVQHRDLAAFGDEALADGAADAAAAAGYDDDLAVQSLHLMCLILVC
jgi:hypothetical protein